MGDLSIFGTSGQVLAMRENVIVIFEVLIRIVYLADDAGAPHARNTNATQGVAGAKAGYQAINIVGHGTDCFFVSLLPLNECVVGNIASISPNTVLAWHRKLATRRWTYRQKPLGRPVTEDEVRNLVIEMKTNNPRWGARRIVGELLNRSKHTKSFGSS